MELIDLPLDLHRYIIFQSRSDTIKEKREIIKMILNLCNVNKRFNIIYNNKILWDKLYQQDICIYLPENSKYKYLKIFRNINRPGNLFNVYLKRYSKLLFTLVRCKGEEYLLRDLKFALYSKNEGFIIYLLGNCRDRIEKAWMTKGKNLIKSRKEFIGDIIRLKLKNVIRFLRQKEYKNDYYDLL